MSMLLRLAAVVVVVGWADPPVAKKPTSKPAASQPTGEPASRPSTRPAKKAKPPATPEAEIERLRAKLAKASRELEEARAHIDRLTGKAETDARLAEGLASSRAKGSELCSWLMESPTVWTGRIRIRHDSSVGVELTLGAGIGKMPVTITAKLADGQDLDGLTFGRIVDIKGTVCAMRYSPAPRPADREIEIHLEGCSILKKW